MEFDGSSVIGHGEAFGNEGGAHGGFCELVELIMCESSQNTAFSDSTVSYSDCLDLQNGLLAGHLDV